MIAWLALAVATVDLIWRMIDAWRKRSRVIVSLADGVIPFPPPLEGKGFPFIAMVARNVGDRRAQILMGGFVTETGQMLGTPDAHKLAPSMPAWIEPGEQVDWSLMATTHLVDELSRFGYSGPTVVWAAVNLGSGRRVESRNSIVVTVSGGAIRGTQNLTPNP